MTTTDVCALCGLPLTHGARTLAVDGKSLSFCCIGCRQVYTILMEAGTDGDLTTSDLFRECQALGIIPSTADDLNRIAATDAFPPANQPIDPAPHDDTLPLAIDIHGMWCPACAWVIQRAVSQLPGVSRAACHFSGDRLSCHYDPRQSRPADIMVAIDRLGYRSGLAGELDSQSARRREFVRFAISMLLTMNVMMLSAALYTGFVTELDPDSIFKISLPMFVMTAGVFCYGGSPIFRRAVGGFRTGAFGMETLIAIAASSAFLYSTLNLVKGSIHLYFDTCSMLITLVLLGQILEQRAKTAVYNDLGAFSALVPAKVRRCSPDAPGGRYVPAVQLATGDTFRLTPGETAVADGAVITGTGTMDESTLTGEPRPVGKHPGDRVNSGCTLVDGDLRVRALQVGAESTLMQMIRIMEAALAGKDPRVSRTQRWLLGFVPVIVFLAMATAVTALISGLGAEGAMIRSMTVLVIACPCALGVAVPLARVAGVSIAAREGILVRDFDAFEKADAVSALVMDKTGTVTTGRWRLLSVMPEAGHTADDVLAMAAALEAESRHPIAEEIRRNARHRDLPLPDVSSVADHAEGVSGHIGSTEVKIGSARFVALEEEGDARQCALEDADIIASCVYLSIDSRLAATVYFGDHLRAGMGGVVNALLARGVHLELLSGDAEAVTRQVAQHVGISNSAGALTPEDKARRVGDLKTAAHGVAMVGDGINDAPALAAADLAVSVFSGNALDAEVADISLMRAHPGQVLDFLDIARRVRRNIRQNLALSFVYNVTAVPVAMMGLLSPIVAVIAMLLSSLSVITNTLFMMRRSSRQAAPRQSQSGEDGSRHRRE